MDRIAVSRFVTKEFQAAEALKTLRTNLMFSGADVKLSTPFIPALMIGKTSDGATRVGDEMTAMLTSICATISSNWSIW